MHLTRAEEGGTLEHQLRVALASNLQTVSNLFYSIDRDHDGFITPVEFAKAVRDLGCLRPPSPCRLFS